MSSKGALVTGATGRSPPANFRTTRSLTKATLPKPNVSSQAATLEKKKAKSKAVEAEARKTLIGEGCLNDETIITHHSILDTLSLIIQKYDTTAPQGLTRVLTALAALLSEANNATSQLAPAVEALTQKLGERIERSMQEEMSKLSADIKTSVAEQCKSIFPPEPLNAAVTTLKQVAADMNKTIGEATTATSQITDTALTYKEALITTVNQVVQPSAMKTRLEAPQSDREHALALGIDKKARQVLLDTATGEDNCMNIYEVKEKAAAALSEIAPPPPPGAEIQEVIKLRNGSLILQFASKDAADWLRIPANEAAFTRRFDPDTTIRDRVHPIMVPRVPIIFDPDNPMHLREIEETNRMPTKSIKKVRWIKPIYRRAPEQKCAHAIFTITLASEANRILKDGIYICSARSFPQKLKYEPKQCMKCCRWGHFAASCRAQTDTCSTCGNHHKTNECKAENSRYCVSCKIDTHASWDRACPEFTRKCDEYNNFHPENNLVYFPTDEDWTLTARPGQIPFEDKFPTRLAIGSLPLPNRTARQLPTRPIGKKGKRSNNNNDNSQAVLEKFFDKLVSPQTDPADIPPARVDDDDNKYDTHHGTEHTNLLENLLPQQHRT